MCVCVFVQNHKDLRKINHNLGNGSLDERRKT